MRLWCIGPWHAFGPWGEEDDYGVWKSWERRAFFLLIFTGEDNEGKHFHFKGIVHRKSECDLSGQGSL